MLSPHIASDAGKHTRLAAHLPPLGLLMLCVLLATLAFAARAPWELMTLGAANLLLVLLLCRHPQWVLNTIVRMFAWQTATIVALHLFRFGVHGLVPGMRTSCQLLLAFVPGMVFLRATPQPRLLRSLHRVLPYRMAFVVATSMRFVPLLVREIRRIREVQILRGARILPRDLGRPWNWPDVVRCMVVPAVIQSLVLAADIARAAAARDFGCGPRRTCWPGP